MWVFCVSNNSEMVHFVLLMGAERVGKSTLAAHLVAKYGYVEISFAAALKRTTVALWNDIVEMMEPTIDAAPLTLEDTIDPVKKETAIPSSQRLQIRGRTVSPRVLLQWLGTDIMRTHVAGDVWVQAAIADIRTQMEKGLTKFVISDFRFANEGEGVATFARHLGTPSIITRIRIVRGDISGEELAALKDAALVGHPSASGWVTMDADIELANTFTAEWITSAAKQIVAAK